MFKKAIVWGCGLHQHTNSYVYAAFHKAFKAMGFDAYWLNKDSDVSGMDFANSLFITEGQHDGNIPLRNDCKYVTHNCCDPKWETVKRENRLGLQVYTDDVLQWETTKLAPGTYVSADGHGLFQPWATDLLPEEINLDWADLPRKNECHWVGTYSTGEFGNTNEIDQFKAAARENGISFHFHPPGSSSFEDNKRLIQESYLAPAIHGTWQARKGYIACRVFKNISYGQMAGTNCLRAAEIFDGNLIFNSDCRQLFHDLKKIMEDKGRVKSLMKIVKEKHTYINRVQTILSVI